MNALAVDLWPLVVSTIFTLVVAYVGFIHKLRIEVAVLKQKVENLQKRVDSHSKKQDDIIMLVTDLKEDVSEKLNNILIDIAKISTTLNIIEPKPKKGA